MIYVDLCMVLIGSLDWLPFLFVCVHGCVLMIESFKHVKATKKCIVGQQGVHHELKSKNELGKLFPLYNRTYVC